MSKPVMRVGIIGGGQMGRGAAAANDEAVLSHELFAATLKSHEEKTMVTLWR
jgi:3-hydroxyacyl-CoA dehydrogenase